MVSDGIDLSEEFHTTQYIYVSSGILSQVKPGLQKSRLGFWGFGI